MEKRGWIRIVEASVSALIVLAALFVFYTQQHTPVEQDLGKFARSMLEEIALNVSSRREVLAGNLNNVNRTIAERLQGKNLIFEMRVCNLNDACGKSRYTPGNVYSAERVITGQLAKKIRLFMWRAA